MSRISEIENAINDIIERRPHSKDAVTAFKPVLLEKTRWKEKLEPVSPVTDVEQLKKGIPVIRQTKLFLPGDPWQEIILSLSSAAGDGFPEFRKDFDTIKSSIRKSPLPVHDFLGKFPESDEEFISEWSRKMGIRPDALSFVLFTAIRTVLEKRGEEYRDHIKAADWDEGYCPVCGSFPSLAIIQEKTGRRKLNCSNCAFEWDFSRVDCPYCGDHAPEGMDFFFIDGNQQESADVCHKCKRYIITLNQVSDLTPQDREASSISLAHMDMIMQDKGFAPMAFCAWNVF
ncbi:MAG: formate dehydrogenase accessory protein FdhE [Syntrophales bacterium]|nr:formate dehydrogenase accessory protein FdhE [Syntrophales bacterium]